MSVTHLIRLIKMAGGAIAGGVIILMSFLTGETHSTPSMKLPKTLIEFVQTHDVVPDEDQVVFLQARIAQMNNEPIVAQQLYTHLLQTYPDNPVITHNLNLAKSHE